MELSGPSTHPKTMQKTCKVEKERDMTGRGIGDLHNDNVPDHTKGEENIHYLGHIQLSTSKFHLQNIS